MISFLQRIYPEFPPIRPQRVRLAMVGLGSVCFILGFVAFNREAWTAIPWLLAAGASLKLMGYFAPERWFFRSSQRQEIPKMNE